MLTLKESKNIIYDMYREVKDIHYACLKYPDAVSRELLENVVKTLYESTDTFLSKYYKEFKDISKELHE